MKLTNLGRFTRTIQHLRSSQLIWRGRYAVARKLPAPLIPLPPAFDASCVRQLARFGFVPAVPLFRRPESTPLETLRLVAAGDFEHLNQRIRVGRSSPDWMLGPRTKNRLWIVTLHYHYWIHDLAEIVRKRNDESREAEELLIDYWADWIERCGLDIPGSRELAWNTFAVATRIGWWARACLLLGRPWFEMRLRFAEKVLKCLWRQAEYVFRNVEWDLRGNHLMRDACGLAWAARLLDDSRSERWMSRATELALAQIEEQILSDGGHFERSPMYHLQVMEDVLTLASLVENPEARAILAKAWRQMADFAQWMQHPDGEIPLLNDAAIGAALTAEQMITLGSNALGLSSNSIPRAAPRGGRYFDATGLVVWRGKHWTVFFDVGEVGPGCQPGHAHADSLAVECSLDGRRLFVDPGTFAYDHHEKRHYDRSTAAHNTVCIDETDSSEVWHVFRVGGRARPCNVKIDIRANGTNAAAAHDGYDRLSGSPRHLRRVDVDDECVLKISDRIDGGGTHQLSGGYLIDPAWNVDIVKDGWELTDGERQVRVCISGRKPSETTGDATSQSNLQLDMVRRPYHPEFGREIETTRLEWRWLGKLPMEVTTRVEAIKCTFSF